MRRHLVEFAATAAAHLVQTLAWNQSPNCSLARYTQLGEKCALLLDCECCQSPLEMFRPVTQGSCRAAAGDARK